MLDAQSVIISDAEVLDGGGEFFKRCARIAHERKCGVFVGVKLGDVDVDEPDGGILKCGLGSGSEITVARTNADDQIGFSRQDICSGRARYADGAKLLRMVIVERTLAGLCLAHWNAGLRCKSRECSGSV